MIKLRWHGKPGYVITRRRSIASWTPGPSKRDSFHEGYLIPHEDYLHDPTIIDTPYMLNPDYYGLNMISVNANMIGVLIPLPSSYKGPIYTIPGKGVISHYDEPCSIAITAAYKHIDTPPFAHVTTEYSTCSKKQNRYLVAPLIKSLFSLSDYNLNDRGFDREIVISQVSVTSWLDEQKITTVYRDDQNKDALIGTKGKDAFLTRLGFDDMTDAFFHYCKASVIESYGSNFVFVHIPNTGVCYKLNIVTFTKWREISSLRIEIFSSDDLNGDPACDMEMTNLIDMLKACLLLPDLFYFDSYFYRQKLSYRITINQKNAPEPIIVESSYVLTLQDRFGLYSIIDTALFSH